MKNQSLYFFLQRWLINTPIRALNLAYNTATLIQQIEYEYFMDRENYTKFLNSQPEMNLILELCFKRYLFIIKLRLAEFLYSYRIMGIQKSDYIPKLQFIDQVLEKYKYIQSSSAKYSGFKQTTTNPSQADKYSRVVTIETQARKIIY